MVFYKRVLHKLNRLMFQWLLAGRERQKLASSKDAMGQALYRAISAARYDQLSDAERHWVEKIETLRETLNASTEPVEIEDFGAGDGDANLSQDEMAQGRVFYDQVGNVCRRASKSQKWASVLFHLVRECKPSAGIELGVCLGISSSYQTAAMALNEKGKMYSLEGASGLARLAQRNLDELGLERVQIVVGRFSDTLDGVLNEAGRIDYAFIDGHHDEQATLDYFNQMKPYLADNAVVVFDDIRWSDGMERAWKHIVQQSAVAVSVDLHQIGICVYRPGVNETLRVRMEI